MIKTVENMLTPKIRSKKETKSGRVDAPAGKQQYMDKEESTRPNSRVDAPVGKAQYMDSEEKPKPNQVEPTGQNTQSTSSSRPHRVDYSGQSVQGTNQRPICTEVQHIDKDAMVAADKSTMSVYYSVTVTSFGKYKAKVLDFMEGKNRTRSDSEFVAPYKYSCGPKENVFEMAEKLSLLGAKVLVKKTIVIDITIAST